MSFVLPLMLLLFLPLGGALVLARSGGATGLGHLPGAWHRVVAPALRGYLAARSGLARAGVPLLCFAIAVPVILALARPGIDARNSDAIGQRGARVIVLDVGADLARHRQFVDAVLRAAPGVPTSVFAVAEHAYRIVPFTADPAQINRYVRVLDAGMMPKPGQRPHEALAAAERSLAAFGAPAAQIVLVTARAPPDQIVAVPPRGSGRFVVALGAGHDWSAWAGAQGARLADAGSVGEIAAALGRDAKRTARAEIPTARHEVTSWLIGLAALLWLLLFRRRSS